MAGKKGKSGRQPELTPAIADSIVKDVRTGLAEGRAALKLGFGSSTVSTWKKRGERDIAEGKTTVFSKFTKDMQIADVEFEQARLARVLKAGQSDKYWGANMAILRSKYPHWRIKDPTIGIQQGGVTVTMSPQDEGI